MQFVGRRIRGALAIIVAATAAGAATAGRAEVTAGEIRAVAASSDALGCDVYQQIKGEGNVVFSPLALSTSLKMAALGSRGKTSAELGRVLHLPETPNLHVIAGAFATGFGRSKDFSFAMDNQLWVSREAQVSAGFAGELKKYYKAAAAPADFSDVEKARGLMNASVARATGDRMAEVAGAGSIAGDARMVATSAAYLRGAWENPFNPQVTVTGDFFVTPQKKIGVSMMHDARELRYGQTAEYQAIELPYKGGKLGLLVLVPREGKTLAEVEKRLSAAHLRDLSVHMSDTRVALTLPKFKIATRTSLAPALTALGLTAATSPGAEFAGISDGGDLRVSAVEHAAAIEVAEEGSDPATPAAPAAKDASGERPTRVVVDRPFAWMVVERNSRMVFLMGRVADPTK